MQTSHLMGGFFLRGGNGFAFLLFFDFFHDALGSFQIIAKNISQRSELD